MARSRTLRLNRARIERLCAEKGLRPDAVMNQLPLERRTALKALRGEPVYTRTAKLVADALGVEVEYLSVSEVPSDLGGSLKVHVGVRPVDRRGGKLVYSAAERLPPFVDGLRFLLSLRNASPEPLILDSFELQVARQPAAAVGQGEVYEPAARPFQLDAAHVLQVEITETGWKARWPLLGRTHSNTLGESDSHADLFEADDAGPLTLTIGPMHSEVISGSILASAPGAYKVSFSLRWLHGEGHGEWGSPTFEIQRTGAGPAAHRFCHCSGYDSTARPPALTE